MRNFTILLCIAALGCGPEDLSEDAVESTLESEPSAANQAVSADETAAQESSVLATTDAPAEEPTAEPEDPFADLVLVNVETTVYYDGLYSGALQVGIFKTYPATGGPVAFKRIEEPVFPQQVTLKNVEAGTWFVVAQIDQLPESPTLPGPEDPQGGSEPVVIEFADDAPSAELTILDP